MTHSSSCQVNHLTSLTVRNQREEVCIQLKFSHTVQDLSQMWRRPQWVGLLMGLRTVIMSNHWPGGKSCFCMITLKMCTDKHLLTLSMTFNATFIVAKHFPDISGLVVLQLHSLKTKTYTYVSFLESYYDYG